MPIPPPSKVPQIIEQLFQKYESLYKDETSNTLSRKQLFIELAAVFGQALLERSLRILDEQTITIYKTELNDHEIVEITVGKSAHVIKLFLGVNFCTCDYFERCVLQLDLPLPASSSSKTSISTAEESYTCEHVLAVRLAKLLNSPSLHEQTVSEITYAILISQIDDSDVSVDEEPLAV